MKKLNTNKQSIIQRLLEKSPRGGAWMRMFFMLVIIMMSSAFVMAQEKYGFKVAGVDVTSDNYLDLTEINGVSGKVYFDPNTRTLTLDNATIEANDCNAILNETCDYLLIELIGTNTINVTNSAGIYTRESTVILGDGGAKLSVKSDLCALLFGGCPLEINNCWLEAEGKWGISASYNEAEEVLTIRNSHVEATGPTGSICDIAGLKLEGCYIDIPSKAAYDADTKSVAMNGETVTSRVVIEPNSYGIYIADKPVTTLNYKDLTSIYGVSGSASYDPDTKTLTLDNATIERNSTDGTGIVNKTVSDFTVKLIGNNTVTADLASMVLNQTSTITGDGSLHLTSKRFCGLDMEGASVTINNTSLFVKGGYGIAGYIGAKSEVLTVRNSYVEAEGSGSGSISLISDLILDNCAITQPVGAEFDADQKAVVLNGEVLKSKVVIEPSASGINDITADVPARKKGIFTVHGVKQTQSWNELPAGIYIVDGVKRVKK
ncbi:peptidase [Prevotella sp.]|uniref:peptidase n=1 Tax=Prevotella sp. TaxID=59823 RepID=UPI0025F9231D|nr:peptidase [Prevotella sp.]